MSDYPPPLVPPEIDLRDFQFMPLDVVRLRDCGLVSDFEDAEIVAAILLWAASWHQVPASSLPEGDKQLAKLAGYGKGIRDFLKVKAGALHRCIRCSDGRWYHPVVAEKAAEGWNAKLKEEHKRACDRQRKANKERNETRPMPPQPPLLSNRTSEGVPCWRYWDSDGTEVDSSGIPDDGLRKSRLKGRDSEVKGSEGTGKGQGQERDGVQNAAVPRAGPESNDPIFGPYIALMHRKGVNPGHARAFIGLMRQAYGDTLVLQVLADAEREDITGPIPWVKAALKTRAGQKSNGASNRQESLEERNRKAVQDWQPPETRDAAG